MEHVASQPILMSSYKQSIMGLVLLSLKASTTWIVNPILKWLFSLFRMVWFQLTHITQLFTKFIVLCCLIGNFGSLTHFKKLTVVQLACKERCFRGSLVFYLRRLSYQPQTQLLVDALGVFFTRNSQFFCFFCFSVLWPLSSSA